MSNGHSPLTEAELHAKLQEEAENAKTARLMLIGGGAAALLGSVINGLLGTLLFLGGVVSAVLGFVALKNIKSSAKESAGSQIAEEALKEIFDQVDFQPKGHISKDVIRNTDMGFPFSFNCVQGSDLIRASYKGVAIEMSDIRLSDEHETFDDNGGVDLHAKIRFEGLWLMCSFGRTLAGDVLLCERRSNLADKLKKTDVVTENEVFNQRFRICSDTPMDAFSILTPHVMECLLRLDDKSGGTTYMRFLREGTLHIALHTRRDMFELHDPDNTDVAALRQQFKGEIQYVLRLLDELLQNETLFAKE